MMMFDRIETFNQRMFCILTVLMLNLIKFNLRFSLQSSYANSVRFMTSQRRHELQEFGANASRSMSPI